MRKAVNGFVSLGIVAIGIYAIKQIHASPLSPITPIVDNAIAPLMGESYRAQVQKVSDGDTITLQNGTRVRFCGIDAPESDQPGGDIATQHLKDLVDLGGGSVIVHPVETDRYGRTVAEVWVEVEPEVESLINVKMIMDGMAWHYSQYSGGCPNSPAYGLAEGIARDRGIYPELLGAIAPWEWRRGQR